MSLLFKSKGVKRGFDLIVNPQNSPLRWLHFGILYLPSEGNSYVESSGDKEVAVCILNGKVDIRISSKYYETFLYENLGNREDVFSGLATAVYIPSESEIEICAITSGVEVAIVKATSSSHVLPSVILPKNISLNWGGNSNWRRQVATLIGDNVNSEKLVLGETRNPSGNWSSYPPHKHDTLKLPGEIPLEEVYFFKLKPAQGFGIQWIYSEGDEQNHLNEVYVVENNDAIVIPRGYHHIVAAAGY